MPSVNFYEIYNSGLLLRSERSLDKLVKWIGRNKSILEVGCYRIEYAGITIGNVFKDVDGSLHFDRMNKLLCIVGAINEITRGSLTGTIPDPLSGDGGSTPSPAPILRKEVILWQEQT